MNAMEVMRTLATNFEGLHRALLFVALGMGIILVINGLWELSQYSNQRSQGASPLNGLYKCMFGSILVTVPATAQVLSQSIFETDAGLRTMISYSAVPTNNQAAAMLTILFAFITFYGWYGIVRGVYIMANLGSAGGRDYEASDAFVRMGFGTVCANALLATDVIAASLGVENWVRQYIN